MRPFLVLAILFSLLSGDTLWAAPGQVENNNYKVSLSETLPGLDAPGTFLSPDAAITLTVTEKLRSQQTLYPLKAYSIPSYFFLEDTLNLIARTTLLNTSPGPRYSLTQLNLSNPSDSRQLQNLRQYSLSPDQQNLLMVVDKDPATPWVGMMHLSEDPPAVEWFYAESAGINLFKTAFQGPVTAFTVNDPIGWSADSLSAAFLFSVDDGTRGAGGNPLWKDYLANLELGDKGWKVSAQPLDLSAYHFHAGGALTDLRFDGRQARLFFTSDNSTNPVEADFKPVGP